MVNTGDAFMDYIKILVGPATVLAVLGLLATQSKKIRNYFKSSEHYFKKGDRIAEKNKSGAIEWYIKGIKDGSWSGDTIWQGVKSRVSPSEFKISEEALEKAAKLLESRTRSVAYTMKLIAIYKKRCESEPDNPIHMEELRKCHLFLEEHTQQVDEYNRLASVYGWLARCRAVNAATYEQSEAEIKSALEIDPCCAIAHYAQGFVLTFRKGKSQAAIDAYTKAIKYNSSFALAYHERGVTYYRHRNISNDLVQAKNDLETAITLNPKYVDTYMWLGQLFEYGLKDNDQAAQHYTKAIELDPHYGRAYRYRCRVYRKMDKEKRAAADRKKAAKLRAAQKKKEVTPCPTPTKPS